MIEDEITVVENARPVPEVTTLYAGGDWPRQALEGGFSEFFGIPDGTLHN